MATEAEPLGRPAWTGAITFGLVAVPVRLYPATVSHHGPVLHMVHREDGARVRNRKFCEAEQVEVPPEEIVRGAELPTGETVVLTDEDMNELPLPSAHVIDVHAFVPESEINGLSWENPYYVGLAEKAPAKPYALLARALRESGQVAVTKVTMRSRESLAILRERNGLLILQTVKWPDEIRGTTGISRPGADETVRPQEIKFALQLGESIGAGFELDAERDQYVVALEQLLRSKIGEGEAPHAVEAAVPAAPVVDLMAALKASISETQAKRETEAEPAKKTAAKKTAKKTPAKRTPRRAS